MSWAMSYPFYHLCYLSSTAYPFIPLYPTLFIWKIQNILANHHTVPIHSTTDYWSTYPSTHTYCPISLSLLCPINSLEVTYSVQLHLTCPINQNYIILSTQHLLFSSPDCRTKS
jgi:hypothetical protein